MHASLQTADNAARVELVTWRGKSAKAAGRRGPATGMKAAMKHSNIIVFCLILGIAIIVGLVYDKGTAGLVALVGFAVMAVMNTWGNKS